MLSQANKEALLRLGKKAGITVGFMAIAVFASAGIEALGLLDLSPTLSLLIGSVLGQVSDWAEEHYKVGARVAAAVAPMLSR